MQTDIKVRFILQSFFSRPDINGNRYWMSQVTSTKTGKSLLISTPHSSNMRGQLRELGADWDEIHEAQDTMMAIRDFKRKEKFLDMRDSCRDKPVRDTIAKLEEV